MALRADLLASLSAVCTASAPITPDPTGTRCRLDAMTKLSVSFRRRCLIVEKLTLYLAPFLSLHTFTA